MQVPSLEAPQVEETPLPGRPYPRISDEVTADAFGAGVARGLQDVSTVATQVQAREKQQQDQLRVIDANTQLETARTALLYGKDGQGGAYSLHGPDAVNLPNKLLPQYDQLAQQIAGTLTPDQQRIFQRHIATTRSQLDLDLNRYEYEESNRLADATFANGAKAALENAARDWRDPIAIGKARADIKGLVELEGQHKGWTQEISDDKTQQLLAQLHGGVIDSMLADHAAGNARAYFSEHRGELLPKEAQVLDKQVRAGEVEEQANRILGAFQQSGPDGARMFTELKNQGYSPQEQDQIVRMVESGRAAYAQLQRQDPKVRAQLDGISGRIAQGQVLPSDLGAVDKLWRLGALTDDARLTMRDEVLRADKKGSAAAEALAYAREAFDNHRPLDPRDSSDKKAVNLMLAMSTVGQPPGSDAFNTTALSITQRVGVVPESAVNWGRSQLVGGTTQEAVAGAQFFANLQRVNPRAYLEALDPETRSLAGAINQLTVAGTAPQKAVELARENASREPTQQKFLSEAWNRQRTNRDLDWTKFNAELIRKGLADDENYTTPGLLWGRNSSSVPAVPGAMAAEFSDLSRAYFGHTGGNLELARQLALNDLKATWGVSTVNGQRELMKFAPEHMVPGLTADDIRTDLAKEGYGAAHLVESPQETAASGGRIWNLTEKDNLGAWDVVRGEDNLPLRYQLPQPAKALQAQRPSAFERIRKEFQDEEDREALQRTRAREEYAAEHQLRQPGF